MPRHTPRHTPRQLSPVHRTVIMLLLVPMLTSPTVLHPSTSHPCLSSPYYTALDRQSTPDRDCAGLKPRRAENCAGVTPIEATAEQRQPAPTRSPRYPARLNQLNQPNLHPPPPSLTLQTRTARDLSRSGFQKCAGLKPRRGQLRTAQG